MSDTHSIHRKMIHNVPDGDLLLVAGDVTNVGALEDISSFNIWLETLPHTHKIVIAGNHDWCFQKHKEQAKERLSNAIYLEDSSVKINGLKIYGSPWQPEFFQWAFNLPRGEELAKKWAKIPDDTDILVTHGPPFNILDKLQEGNHTGCSDLLKRIKKVKPCLSVFGHIHEAYGVSVRKDTTFINASICTRSYAATNRPIVVDINSNKKTVSIVMEEK
jgi:Icc-related predicted phosphoesterase